MKIYNMVKIDIDTGKILSEDFFEYTGPLALCQDFDDFEGGGDPSFDDDSGSSTDISGDSPDDDMDFEGHGFGLTDPETGEQKGSVAGISSGGEGGFGDYGDYASTAVGTAHRNNLIDVLKGLAGQIEDKRTAATAKGLLGKLGMSTKTATLGKTIASIGTFAISPVAGLSMLGGTIYGTVKDQRKAFKEAAKEKYGIDLTPAETKAMMGAMYDSWGEMQDFSSEEGGGGDFEEVKKKLKGTAFEPEGDKDDPDEDEDTDWTPVSDDDEVDAYFRRYPDAEEAYQAIKKINPKWTREEWARANYEERKGVDENVKWGVWDDNDEAGTGTGEDKRPEYDEPFAETSVIQDFWNTYHPGQESRSPWARRKNRLRPEGGYRGEEDPTETVEPLTQNALRPGGAPMRNPGHYRDPISNLIQLGVSQPATSINNYTSALPPLGSIRDGHINALRNRPNQKRSV